MDGKKKNSLPRTPNTQSEESENEPRHKVRAEECTQDSVADNPKKKSLPRVPPLTEQHGKTSLDGKKKNSLPRAPTTQKTREESESAPNHEEDSAADNSKKKPLPRVPPLTEQHGKKPSLNRKKKNSLPRLPPAKQNSELHSESCPGTPCETAENTEMKALPPIPPTKSFSRRVTIGGPKERIQTSDKQKGNEAHSAPHSVPIGEVKEHTFTSNKQDSECPLPTPEAPIKTQNVGNETATAEPPKSAPTRSMKEQTAGVRTEEALMTSDKSFERVPTITVNKKSLICRVPLPEPTIEAPTYDDPKEQKMGGDNHKKSSLRRIPLPEPKETAPTYDDPKLQTTSSDNHKSMLRKGPLPDAPMYDDPKGHIGLAELGDKHKKNSLRRAPLPEPTEVAPTYSNYKELKDEDKKALVESVVYDDPLPVTGVALSRSLVHKDAQPVYDDPLPVKRSPHVTQSLNISCEARVQPEPYEIPISKQ